jgi:hypothetical protein
MANEFSFMFINIEDTLAQYKEGMLSKDMVVEEIQCIKAITGSFTILKNLIPGKTHMILTASFYCC